MALPFFIFWVLILICRRDLGWRGVGICVAIWIGLLVGVITLGTSGYIFIAAQALLDCVLILIIFKGDIRIR